MAARQITDLGPRGDTGRRRRLAATVPVEAPTTRRPAEVSATGARLLVWGMVVAFAGLFSLLSVLRYRTYSTGRFDLGNMVQAIWSTSQGRPLETTDISGVQFNRLGAHVDPILVLFTPLWQVWSSPEALLVAQACIVALGALPAFWLARRWLGDPRLGVLGAGLYLLYPALQNATLFDFHPVTLAAPLLMFCIWAAEEGRWWTLGICATLAALTQEQVGTVLIFLAAWMWLRHPDRRRAALIMGGAAAAWVVVALTVIMPAFAVNGSENPHISRYGRLGDSPDAIFHTLLTRPWEVADMVLTPGRGLYLLALLLPLLLLPLLAPLLALVALPQLVINVLASSGPVQTVEYHYAVVITPFLVAAAILGLARLRAGRYPRLAWLARWAVRPRWAIGAPLAAVIVAGAFLGPLPVWKWVPGAWASAPVFQFTEGEQTRALDQAVGLVPEGVPVSATNDAGSHLSERRRIALFPVIPADVDWVLVVDGPLTRAIAKDRPTLRPPSFYVQLRWIETSSAWRRVYRKAGVRLYRRVPAQPAPGPRDTEPVALVGPLPAGGWSARAGS